MQPGDLLFQRGKGQKPTEHAQTHGHVQAVAIDPGSQIFIQSWCVMGLFSYTTLIQPSVSSHDFLAFRHWVKNPDPVVFSIQYVLTKANKRAVLQTLKPMQMIWLIGYKSLSMASTGDPFVICYSEGSQPFPYLNLTSSNIKCMNSLIWTIFFLSDLWEKIFCSHMYWKYSSKHQLCNPEARTEKSTFKRLTSGEILGHIRHNSKNGKCLNLDLLQSHR